MIRRLSIVWCFLIRFECGESSTCGSLLVGGPGVRKVIGARRLRVGGARGARELARLSERVLAHGVRAGEAVGTLAGSEFPANAVG
jgi:hypothetical protein